MKRLRKKNYLFELIKQNAINGICVETNSHFANIMYCSVPLVSGIIQELVNEGKIEVQYKQKTTRIIKVL